MIWSEHIVRRRVAIVELRKTDLREFALFIILNNSTVEVAKSPRFERTKKVPVARDHFFTTYHGRVQRNYQLPVASAIW